MRLVPYLNFNGKCKEAMDFYCKALDGKITAMFSYGESPMAKDMSADSHDQIMHSALESAGATLMGADGPPRRGTGSNGVCINLMVDDPAEADRIFAALSDGAEINMPIEETFWAHRFGGLVDRYGMPWMVNCLKPPM